MKPHEEIIASLAGRRVAVVGGGTSGLAAARLLLARGAKVLISDAAPREKVRAEILALPAAFELGGHTSALLQEELLVLSPGVDPRHPVLAEARARGVPMCGEIELGYSSLATKPRLVAVTGTNGKTTTTALIGHICTRAGRKTFVGGNIGAPLCDLTDAVDIAVLELSSYQCEGLISFDADVAVWLNLTPDHLERYASVDDYAAAKERLFTLQAAAHTSVLCADDLFCRAAAPRLRSRVVWFGASDRDPYPLDATPLLGAHNRQNQRAAIAACRALGIEDGAIEDGLRTFQGVEHRIEKVAEQAGITWYNDSKGTNDDAASKALAAVAAPIVWLAGGKDKGGGYELSRRAAQGKVKLAILYGAAAPLIADALRDVCPIERVTTLDEAVGRARNVARRGDSVLLSPACSSFDQFKNYEERGRRFKTLVLEHA